MCRALIIGAGGVGTVVTQKVAANPIFSDVMLASRTKSKCDAVAAAIGGGRVKTAQVDADSVPELCELFRAFRPDIVINVALPYQDLTIMDACLECGVNYLDTANYEPRDEAHFEYSWQWAYQDRFREKGLTAILGCGFDPGVTAIFTAYAAKHHFDEIHYLDIVDCNAGNHGMAFATNFNPEINIREVTQKGRYYENGKWVTTEPHEIHKGLHYPGIGERESYVIYHEELESLVKNFPTIRRARFWMTFGQEYLTHLRVIQNIGMARIDPIMYNGVEIVPIQFLKAVLPDPKSLGANYHGQTSIGCRIRGVKDGKERVLYLQQLRPRAGLQGDRHAGRELHDGCSGGAGRVDVGQGIVARRRRLQRRGVRSRSVPRRVGRAGIALARAVRRRSGSIATHSETTGRPACTAGRPAFDGENRYS